MGKKIPAEMAEQKDKFYKGCKEYGGLKEKTIDEIWVKIEPFAAYGFNKAHAASYGQLAYRTAYLKANYSAEYMTACMTAESGDVETVSLYIEEAKHMGFTILPPDINESFSDFTVVVEDGKVTNKIRFGLNSIKNFGNEIGKAIIAERKAHGPYQSLTDFLMRVLHRNLNKKSLEALIMSGALDRFGDRSNLLGNVDEMLRFNSELRKEVEAPQESLFAGLDIGAPTGTLVLREDTTVIDPRKVLSWEKELLGLYVSGHPLDEYRDRLMSAKQNIKNLLTTDKPPMETVVAGMITDIREIFTKKNNDKMAFIKVQDLSETMEIVIFPKSYDDMRQFLKVDNLVMIKGKITDREGQRSMIADKMQNLE
jgi:DNA polymerase-3 subunit alpha